VNGGSATRLVLFDLDGTLVDTAADLAAAANRMRLDRGLALLPAEQTRPIASHGARGMIGAAFALAPGEPGYDALREEFLRNYEAAICVHSRLFDGAHALLDGIEARGKRWGIVTNKPQRYTAPLLQALALDRRAACVVSGDTTPRPKPDPAPLHHALRLTATAPGDAIYVGDDLRDIAAGRAAGVTTFAATYGYLGADAPPETWGADYLIGHLDELRHWLHGPEA
jgi:phosphoglycolate phosphatase